MRRMFNFDLVYGRINVHGISSHRFFSCLWHWMNVCHCEYLQNYCFNDLFASIKACLLSFQEAESWGGGDRTGEKSWSLGCVSRTFKGPAEMKSGFGKAVWWICDIAIFQSSHFRFWFMHHLLWKFWDFNQCFKSKLIQPNHLESLAQDQSVLC